MRVLQRWAHLTTPVWGIHHLEYMATPPVSTQSQPQQESANYMSQSVNSPPSNTGPSHLEPDPRLDLQSSESSTDHQQLNDEVDGKLVKEDDVIILSDQFLIHRQSSIITH